MILPPEAAHFGVLASPVVNDSGQVAFFGRALGVWGIFLFSQGSISRLVGLGDRAPEGGNLACFTGSSAGTWSFPRTCQVGPRGYFSLRGRPPVSRIVTTSDSGAEAALNDAEQVAYLLNQGSVGLYLFAQGQTTKLAQLGDPAPGGDSFSSFHSPAVNATGQVAFVAGLSPGFSGVFLFSGGGLNSVVHPGDISPEGDTFTYVITAAMSADGQVAFTGRLSNSIGGSTCSHKARSSASRARVIHWLATPPTGGPSSRSSMGRAAWCSPRKAFRVLRRCSIKT